MPEPGMLPRAGPQKKAGRRCSKLWRTSRSERDAAKIKKRALYYELMGHSEGMIHDDRKVKWYDSVLHAIIY